jgi:hypothetical protein
MGPYVETTESAAPALLDLSPESILVRTTLCGVDTSSYGLTAIQRVQPGEPVAGNPLGGFCEGGRAQVTNHETCPYPPSSQSRPSVSGGGRARGRQANA